MDFEYSDRTKALLEKLHKFMDEVIYPAEPVYEEQMEKAKDRWQLPPIIEECKAEAKKRGLWNMFLPADRDSGDTHGTMGLSNLEYAPICEVLGRSSIASSSWRRDSARRIPEGPSPGRSGPRCAWAERWSRALLGMTPPASCWTPNVTFGCGSGSRVSRRGGA